MTVRESFVAAWLMTLGARTGPAQEPQHPLDALTASEISTAISVLRTERDIGPDARFDAVVLNEPVKEAVWSWEPGATLPRREAFLALRQDGAVHEAVVDLASREVVSWRRLPGVQPAIFDEEYGVAQRAALADSGFQEALRERGLADLDQVSCAGMINSPGYLGPSRFSDRRLLEVQCGKKAGDGNLFAHPIEGLIALVDVDRQEVVSVEKEPPVPIPSRSAGFTAEAATTRGVRPRAALPPMDTRLPQGPGFHSKGQMVEWEKWRFHFKIDPRMGPVVGTVTYRDGGRTRRVLYEGSLREIFVPYADPGPGWERRTFFDVGEYKLGKLVVPLQRGVECPEHARFFDAVFADDKGVPYTKAAAACLFEEPGGIEWLHWGYRDTPEARTRRDLVLRFISTVGNYDYLVDWVFRQNGSIEVRVGASGTEEVKAVASRTLHDDPDARDTRYGTLVDEHMVATTHQHFFCFRLDLDVDGLQNRFVEAAPRTVRVDGGARTSGIGLDSRVFRTELEARRPHGAGALWYVENPEVENAMGYPVSFQLRQSHSAPPLLAADEWPRKRAGFIDYELWVTPYRRDELHPAGWYVVQSKGGDGLPTWTQRDRGIENQDIVLWYTLSNTHVVRTEDWPVLSTEWMSFELRPVNFFDQTPSLDLPKAR